jgi:succinyl-CoA synthetase alpha subunit
VTILATPETRVLVQGITGRQASWSVQDMLAYGTKIVAGVVPGRGGETHLGVPVFNLVDEAVDATGAEASLVYVAAGVAGESIREAFDGGISLVVYPGDGLPVHDAVRIRRLAAASGATLIGPNTAGLISPGKVKLGFMPSHCFTPGRLGVISKSGSLSYEICHRLTEAGIGQSTLIGVGGDPIKGVTIGEALRLFDQDPETDVVLIVGEVGGLEEYQAVHYASRPHAKPVAAFIVGRTAPPGRKLGHASALIGSSHEGYEAKASALRAAGVSVVPTLADVVPAVRDLLQVTRQSQEA